MTLIIEGNEKRKPISLVPFHSFYYVLHASQKRGMIAVFLKPMGIKIVVGVLWTYVCVCP